MSEKEAHGQGFSDGISSCETIIADLKAEVSRLQGELGNATELLDSAQGTINRLREELAIRTSACRDLNMAIERQAKRMSDAEQARQELLKYEHELSDAYVRLRTLIPGAFDTPFAPTPQQIWDITEQSLKAVIQARQEAVRELDSWKDQVTRLRTTSGELTAEIYLLQSRLTKAEEAIRAAINADECIPSSVAKILNAALQPVQEHCPAYASDDGGYPLRECTMQSGHDGEHRYGELVDADGKPVQEKP